MWTLGGTPQEDGAGFGLVAVHQKGEVVVTNLLHFEETALGTNVFRLKSGDAVMSTGDTRGVRG